MSKTSNTASPSKANLFFALTIPTGSINCTDLPPPICDICDDHEDEFSFPEGKLEELLQSGTIRGPFPCFCQLLQALIRDICDDQLSQGIAFKFENDYEKFRREVENMMGSLDYFVSL